MGVRKKKSHAFEEVGAGEKRRHLNLLYIYDEVGGARGLARKKLRGGKSPGKGNTHCQTGIWQILSMIAGLNRAEKGKVRRRGGGPARPMTGKADAILRHKEQWLPARSSFTSNSKID